MTATTTANISAKTRSAMMLTREGVNLVLVKSETDAGKRMRRWLVGEVLPSLEDTGRYEVPQRVEQVETLDDRKLAMAVQRQRTAEARELRLAAKERIGRAKIMAELAEKVAWSPDIMQMLQVKAAEIAMGQKLDRYLPQVMEDWFSPTQLADDAKVSVQAIGRIISQLDLRGGEHSKKVVNKAKGHDRAVESYLYDAYAKRLILAGAVEWKAARNLH